MDPAFSGYQRILAATDFSAHGASAVRRAAWLAQQSCRRLVVANVVTDIHHASYRSWIEYLEGNEEDLQRELRQEADNKLKREILAIDSAGIDIQYETLLGEPYEELIHSVQQERCDLIVAGTRGHSGLKRLVLGSTARQLVRQCPAAVWIVKQPDVKPLTTILVAADMSDVSRRGLEQATWLAERAGAARVHILHVLEPAGLSDDLLDRKVAADPKTSVRSLIEKEVAQQFSGFLAPEIEKNAQTHLVWGNAAHETIRLADELKADLIVMGTVGRRGIQRMLLGNTAEDVLTHAECDVLVVKPAGFVSPIAPAARPLHRGPEKG
jgi:nucleotide-binding universal stress UspA family protein